MMRLNEYGDLVLMIKNRLSAKRTMEEAGFSGVRIVKTEEEARLEGYIVYIVLVDDLVPAPKYTSGESSIYPGFDTIVIDFRIKLCEADARDLWIKGKPMDLRIGRFFRTRSIAKRRLRAAFGIKDKSPGMFPVLSTGEIWINRKGEVL